jgi:hypothetical protein
MRKEESDGDRVGVEGMLVDIDVRIGVRDGMGDAINVADGLFSSSGVGVICIEEEQAVAIITEPMKIKRDNLNMHHLQKDKKLHRSGLTGIEADRKHI